MNIFKQSIVGLGLVALCAAASESKIRFLDLFGERKWPTNSWSNAFVHFYYDKKEQRDAVNHYKACIVIFKEENQRQPEIIVDATSCSQVEGDDVYHFVGVRQLWSGGILITALDETMTAKIDASSRPAKIKVTGVQTTENLQLPAR